MQRQKMTNNKNSIYITSDDSNKYYKRETNSKVYMKVLQNSYN